MTQQQEQHTDGKSAATCTSSQPSSNSIKARSQLLHEKLTSGKQNPFERVDGKLLEHLHKQASKRIIATTEDAWL